MTPVLVYFNPNSEHVIQMDTSLKGLGAVLLQEGRQVIYSSQQAKRPRRRMLQMTKKNFANARVCFGYMAIGSSYCLQPTELVQDGQGKLSFQAESLAAAILLQCFTRINSFKDRSSEHWSGFKTEFIVLKLKLGRNWITVVGMYRPPSVPETVWKCELSSIFEATIVISRNVYYLGDLNADLLDPDKPPKNG